MNKKYAPLTNSFAIASILGFLASVLFIWQWSLQWGIAFAALFLLMFIASLISARHACPDEQLNLKHHR